jgi:Ca2+-transporting ATPase
MISGLSLAEAKRKLKTEGPNELPSSKPKSLWLIALEVVKEPMFILLISSGLLYITLGDTIEGVVLLGTIFIIIFITFFQHQKTEKALDALKKLSSPRALVLREGIEMRIPGSEVVTEDILLLQEGDRVPADAVLLEVTNLLVDESMLTGESIAVHKSIDKAEIDSTCKVFSGTMVIQGKGKARVIATGSKTEFGQIGVSLSGIRQEATRLQLEMKEFIRTLFIIGVLLSIAVFLAFYVTRGNWMESLLNALASAMAILPEEFLVVMTVFTALGAWRLSKIHVLTRNPAAIETLGATTVLCTDKTGTITQNKMDIAMVFDGMTMYNKEMLASQPETILPLLKHAYLASHPDAIDPMEKAIAKLYTAYSLPQASSLKLIKEYALSKQLMAMTRVVVDPHSNLHDVASKGAPEAIFSLCNITELSPYWGALNQLASNGYRVIAVAKAKMPEALPENQQSFEYELLGLLAFEDPIRKEVPRAVALCKKAGIKVVMITGDYPVTARSIARQIGLPNEYLLTGEELKTLSEEELSSMIHNITIFARVAPEQKLKIVQALKTNQEIVAMTGDGVNDAPALKAAHIGISMGKKGTDVAREASSLVLLDDNFASIVSAMRLGRKIYDNLQKAMSYILAIHVPIIFLALMPAVFPSLPILMMPLHIVFLELIIDPVSSIAFEYEQEERQLMSRQPRKVNEKFFGLNRIFGSFFQGLLLLFMVLVVYFIAAREGHTEPEIRAITFAALIIGNVFLILSLLSKTRSFFAVFKEKNYTVLIIISVAVAMLFMTISIPWLASLFNFQFPGYRHFIISLCGATILLCIFEIIKWIKNKKAIEYRRATKAKK